MTTTNTDSPEAVDAVAAAPALEPKPTRFAAALAAVQGAPKWVLMAVPAAVVALGAYGYVQHGDKLFGDKADTVAQAPMAPMAAAPVVDGPYGEPQGFVPVAYDPYAYGPAYGHYSDAYGRGYGRGYGHGHGNGRARGNFSFNMGGNFDGDAYTAGNGWTDHRYAGRHNGYHYY